MIDVFILAEKLQAQNASVDNVEHYLSVFENDMKMRIDTMKMQFEKISDHFVNNMKFMRKELLRYLPDFIFYQNSFFIYRFIYQK